MSGRRGAAPTYGGRKKSADQPKHAKIRLMQRFGIFMTLTELQRLADRVRIASGTGASDDGSIEFIRSQSNTRKWWRVQIEGQSVVAIYDKTTRGIASFITEEMAAAWQPGKDWSEED